MRPLQREETTKVPAMRGSPVSWVRDTARVTLQHSQKGLEREQIQVHGEREK